jgi:hypothetical protein
MPSILVVITRYNLTLPILRLVLLIWVLFGILKAQEGPHGTPNQYVSDCLCSPHCYVPIPSHLGLNNLDFSGYNKI